jgi:hypothetical protein
MRGHRAKAKIPGDWKEAVGELIGGFTLRLLLWVGCSVLANARGRAKHERM